MSKYPKMDAARKEIYRICGERTRVYADPIVKDGERIGSSLNIPYWDISKNAEWNAYCKANRIIARKYRWIVYENPSDIPNSPVTLETLPIEKRFVYTRTSKDTEREITFYGVKLRPVLINGKWRWKKTSQTEQGHLYLHNPNPPTNPLKFNSYWKDLPQQDKISLVMSPDELIALDALQDGMIEQVKTIPGLFIVE